MHYRDGTEARVGDYVRGTGYNEKNPDGTPRVLHGVVVGLKPGEATCNIEVAHLKAYDLTSSQVLSPSSGYAQVVARGTHVAALSIEYGEVGAFEKV